MRSIVTDRVASWSVGRSVCWSACHTSEPCKNGWTDRDAVWVEDSGGPRELVQIPHGKGQFWGGKGWRKHKFSCIHQVAPMCTVSIIFARWRQCAQMAQNAHCTTEWIQLNRPSAVMQSYVKLLWPVVYSVMVLCG